MLSGREGEGEGLGVRAGSGVLHRHAFDNSYLHNPISCWVYETLMRQPPFASRATWFPHTFALDFPNVLRSTLVEPVKAISEADSSFTITFSLLCCG